MGDKWQVAYDRSDRSWCFHDPDGRLYTAPQMVEKLNELEAEVGRLRELVVEVGCCTAVGTASRLSYREVQIDCDTHDQCKAEAKKERDRVQLDLKG